MNVFKSKTIRITISTSTIIKVLVLAALVWLAVMFIGRIATELQMLAIAAFIAVAFNPAVSWIARHLKSGSRLLSTAIAYIVVLGGVVGFLAYVLTPLIGQTVRFLRELPEAVGSIRNENTALWQLVERYNLENSIENLSADISSRAGEFASQAVNLIGHAGQAVAAILAILVLAFMMLVEGPRWMSKLYEMQPKDKREKRKRVIMRMYGIVTGYVNGQVLISAIGAMFYLVAMVIGSNLVDVPINAVGLAGIVFLFGLIPLIGNTLGALIVVLVAAFSSIPLAIGLAIFAVVYQQIENITIQPHIQSRANHLTPLIVFSSAIIGVGVAGILGAFLAIPTAGCIKILAEEYYLNDRNVDISQDKKVAKKP